MTHVRSRRLLPIAALGICLAGTVMAVEPQPASPSTAAGQPTAAVAPKQEATATGGKIDFNRAIRPILSANCFACHGPDDKHREAGLRLDLAAASRAVLESGHAAIVPGKPDESELVRRITSANPDERMPPAESQKELTSAQIELLKQWIAGGAVYQSHWSFVPPSKQSLPAISDPAWARNGIDYFIRARLEQQGLRPSAAADKHTLIRRLSLDLRGLPATPDEMEAFVGDARPDAYERLVDAFLADPAYGERWARMWLDVARYADSMGYASDPLRTIWLYRNWVVNAFNDNMSFDRFTLEQIAGDLLPDATEAQKIATAFHRNTMTNTEGGTDDEEFRVAAVKDRIDTTLQAWMGLTLGCAKCHSHKYDPVTQHEYYSLYAIFNQSADRDLPSEEPVLEVAPRESIERRNAINAQIAELKKQLEPAANDAKKGIEQRIADLEKSKPSIPAVPVMVELPADKSRETFLMVKGNFLDRGDKVSRGIPASFHSLPEGMQPDRLGVAHWLVDPHNPLTARVAANRFWAQIFGVGLVETEEDFGTQGEPPSHPELLDWLAVEFIRSGWDVKGLLRLIVSSETYRQSSRVTPELLRADPRNRLLSRAPRYRLEAEMVRDQALMLSGLLSRKMLGPSVYPPQPAGLWKAAFNGRDRTWPTSAGEDRYRRGLYTFWRRTIPYPSMTTFDAPSRELCTVRRIRTNTPLQAFVTLNDPVYVEASQSLARRIVAEGGTTANDRASFGISLCQGRPAAARQVDEIVALHQSERAHYASHSEAAMKLATDPLGPLPDGADAAELAAWTVVANVLLNLDGVLTRN